MIMLAFLSLNSLKSLTKKIQLNTSANYKNNRGLSAEANKVGDKLIAIADEKVITREAIIIKLVFDLPYNRIIIKTIERIRVAKMRVGFKSVPIIC